MLRHIHLYATISRESVIGITIQPFPDMTEIGCVMRHKLDWVEWKSGLVRG